ncbi:zinc finger CCCH domain-containing protein 20 [Ricinus communis]|uniref:zinc finger CCCH domain-containing protein 20 n=1 Tax=Ricinus communis TaxID=3988 RepID=UPI000772618B|nr:zinc finger CCCH domain-containing protein 20 [Ricinus communis]|eukprot:XP_015573145.1 LOW QUALITY PROTEIN: zinc finger CCCH domain-containing protein 20 [Ricinus communis]
MMIGEHLPHSNPTVQIPSWDPFLDEPTSPLPSPFSNATTSPFLDSLTALHRYLPSNEPDSFSDDFDVAVDAFSCDHFRMYEFKVRRCARGQSHDWTECPYAHPGEKARRRDPRRYHYSGTACPDFRKGGCKKGDACEFAHGVFECWLHPARYRTQPCKDGPACRRQVCFFAHTPDQLRVLPQQSPRGNRSGSGPSDMEIGSPLRHHFDSYFTKAGSFGSSPTSILTSPPLSPSDSPPISPSSPQVTGGSFGSFNSASELVASMRSLQLGKMKIGHATASWVMQNRPGFGSSRGSSLRPNFCSLPTTPTRIISRVGPGQQDFWDCSLDEEPVMERVESGRDLRAKIYAKLSKENSLGRVDPTPSAPDVGWVSELVK